MEFLFVRHGESTDNAAGVFTGSADPALTELGEAQAAAAAELCAEGSPRWIVSSPLRRARDTAAVIADRCGLEVVVDDRLAEHTKGVLEGEPRSVLGGRHWDDVPGAERTRAFFDRVTAALADLAERDGPGVVVAHAGVARVLECVRVGASPDLLWSLEAVANAEPSRWHWPTMRGVVEYFDSGAGYGWVAADGGGASVLVVAADLLAAEPVASGDRVSFCEVMRRGERCARLVTVLPHGTV